MAENNYKQPIYDVENVFTYHAPQPEDVKKYTLIRAQGKELASAVLLECPETRERSLALTKIEEAIMWANAAIARHKDTV